MTWLECTTGMLNTSQSVTIARLKLSVSVVIIPSELDLNSFTGTNICCTGHYILLTKTTAAQNDVALSYRIVRGLYFLAVIFAPTIL